MPFQLTVRKKALEASTSARSQPPIPSFEPVNLPASKPCAGRVDESADDDLCAISRTEEPEAKPILLLHLSDDSSVLSRHWSDDDDDSDDELLPTAFPKRPAHTVDLSSSEPVLPVHKKPIRTTEPTSAYTVLQRGCNTDTFTEELRPDTVPVTKEVCLPPEKTDDPVAPVSLPIPSGPSTSITVSAAKKVCLPQEKTDGSIVSVSVPIPPGPSKSISHMNCDPPEINAAPSNRTLRKRKKPSPEEVSHAQLLNLAKSQVAATNRPSTLSSSNNALNMDSTHAQLLNLAKSQAASNNTSQRKQKGPDYINSVSGCLLCHFCPCRHLPKQEKKRLAASMLIPDPTSSMNFTNMSPLAALEKHARLDAKNAHPPTDPVVSENSNTWAQYQQMEIQYISRIRRLEQTIAFFDHLAFKAVQDLKRVRSKMAKHAQNPAKIGDKENPEHGSSDDESQEDEEPSLKKTDDKQENKQKLKWNNQFLDYNDFDWEDPSNFPSKLPLDAATDAKNKTFTFRRKKQPTLTQMFASHDEPAKCTNQGQQDSATDCTLWNASKKYALKDPSIFCDKDIPIEIQDAINQQDTNMVDPLAEGEDDTADTHDESGMDHLITLFDESTHEKE